MKKRDRETQKAKETRRPLSVLWGLSDSLQTERSVAPRDEIVTGLRTDFSEDFRARAHSYLIASVFS